MLLVCGIFLSKDIISSTNVFLPPNQKKGMSAKAKNMEVLQRKVWTSGTPKTTLQSELKQTPKPSHTTQFTDLFLSARLTAYNKHH